ncbi:MAG: M23 family metallopeptidase, partial [Faecalibacterium sp.]|nr:M23 family metallopeptidase [Faecalibacterium sp.]
WSMHIIDYEIETVVTTPHPTEDDPEPEPVTEKILHIHVSSKSVSELAEEYHFTQDQKDILNELLSDELRPYLLALCGGTGIAADGVAGSSSLQWPLPGHSVISCHFGEPDAIAGRPHKGADIPAPEGTPILAAHSGTVLISAWNDSYGNQVLLDNGAGLSTRYAHMISASVTAGEAVQAGQVIGYVGSTGDSTGDHLHFEVIQRGIQVDPLLFVTPAS